jgi:hypothetical protein
LLAGFLIGGLGYAPTFDILAAIIVAVTIGLAAFVRDPKTVAAERKSANQSPPPSNT